MLDAGPMQPAGLILSGGGARAAYQAGALTAIAEILGRDRANPFAMICGTSAGAINAAMLGIHADGFGYAAAQLRELWNSLAIEDVYRSDLMAVARSFANWLRSVVMGRHESHGAVALLDNRALRILLESYLDFSKLAAQIAEGHLTALSINATCYRTGQAVSFFQGASDVLPWARSHRIGIPTQLGVDHLLASAAIPFIFPPARVANDFYADGSLRQLAPLSPALHLGAKRILVIAVGRLAKPQDASGGPQIPTLGEIAGYALSSIFLDHLSADLERLLHLNRLVNLVPQDQLALRGLKAGHVDVLVLAPQRSIGKLAVHHLAQLPKSLRLLLRALGNAHGGGNEFISYLLFDRNYCNMLCEIGYDDALARRDEIEAFLGGASANFLPVFPLELR